MLRVRRDYRLPFILALFLASPGNATQWKDMGNASASLDHLYIDLDDIQAEGDLRIARLMTVYPAPRPNTKGILLDHHVHIAAFECRQHLFVGLKTIGFLGEKQVGASDETPGWREKLAPLPHDELSTRTFAAVCGATVAAAPSPDPGKGGTPAPPGKFSSGSGIVADADGYIVTNAHVAGNCKALAVKARNSAPIHAQLDAVDARNDLALIRVAPGYGTPALFRPQTRPTLLGEDIGVIGYPLPGILSNEPKATFGQINSVAGINSDYTLLQISAPVQPGNSGGPVLDKDGAVVGVVVSEISPALASRIGVMPQNINFAIRGELAQIFLSAHGVHFAVSSSKHRLPPEKIAAIGEAATVQIVCVKP